MAADYSNILWMTALKCGSLGLRQLCVRWCLLLGATLCVCALVAQPTWGADPNAPVTDGLLPLSPGDAVSIEVFGQPDMTTTLYVGSDGSIRVPLAGAVHVAGMTAVEAAQSVERALKDGEYLRNPHVTLTVVRSTSQQVSVLGEVRTPGQYAISDHTSLLDILARAGGLTDNSADVIYILRPGSNGTITRYPVNARALMNRDPRAFAQNLRSGDSILVPRAQYFYIEGQVNKPDKYRLEEGMTVLQAITLAGGITPRGSERRVDILRLGKNGRYVSRHARGGDLLQPNDILRVKESIF
jgi:polysaccharide biosynthesis/export protein